MVTLFMNTMVMESYGKLHRETFKVTMNTPKENYFHLSLTLKKEKVGAKLLLFMIGSLTKLNETSDFGKFEMNLTPKVA